MIVKPYTKRRFELSSLNGQNRACCDSKQLYNKVYSIYKLYICKFYSFAFRVFKSQEHRTSREGHFGKIAIRIRSHFQALDQDSGAQALQASATNASWTGCRVQQTSVEPLRKPNDDVTGASNSGSSHRATNGTLKSLLNMAPASLCRCFS